MKISRFFLMAIAFMVIVNVAYAQHPPEEVWNRVYDSGNLDEASGVAVDRAGYVYVAGYSFNGTDDDFRTIKYDPDGNVVWNKVFDSGEAELPYGVAVDDVGNVYLAGMSINGTGLGDISTIKYDPDGNVVWNKEYDSGNDDEAHGVAVDNAGFVYVAGYSDNGTDDDIRTIKYDKDGNVVWNKEYDSGNDDEAHGVAVDNAGFVYVAGCSNNGTDWDFRVIKYDKDGNVVWNKIYDSGDRDVASGVAVDDAGFVYVAGYSDNGTDWDFRVIKYEPNGDIVLNKVYDSGNDDEASGVAVDDAGFIYVGGYSWDTDANFRTIKYDPDGNIVWNKAYDSGNWDEASGVAVDNGGNVYVAGYSDNGTDNDFRTIKYRQFFTVFGRVTEGGSGMPDVNVVISTAGVSDTIKTAADGSYEFPDLPCGEDYTVSAHKPGYTFSPSKYTYSPLNSDKPDQDFVGSLGIVEKDVKDIDVIEERNRVVVKYTLNSGSMVDIRLFNALGTVVNKVSVYKTAGEHSYTFDVPLSGVYFVKVDTGNKTEIMKVVITR